MSMNDFRLFEATPGLRILLRPDAPTYTIVAVTNDYLKLLGVPRSVVVGKGHLDCFKEAPRQQFIGEEKLEESFEYVIREKTAHEIPVQRFDLPGNNGSLILKQWKLMNVPVLNEAGAVEYIIHTIVDITDGLKADIEVASLPGMEKAYRFFMNAPVIIGYLRGDDYVIELANEGLLRVWDRSGDVIGKPLFSAIPELEKQGVRKLLDDVRRTGTPFFAYEYPLTFHRAGKSETLYFDFVYQPLYENEGDKIASGVISVGHEVTQQVQARHKFRNVLDQANDPIVILMGREMILDVANEALYTVWGVDRSAIGKSFVQLFPELVEQGFLHILQSVYDTGLPFQGYETPAYFYDTEGVRRTFYVNFKCQPYREPSGVISGVLLLGSNVTAQVLAKRELEASQRKWRDIANAMPVIVWTANADGSLLFFNDQWYQFTGLSEKESVGLGWTTVLHPDDQEKCLKAWDEARAAARLYELEVRYRRREGDYRWVLSRGLPIREHGKVVAWYGTSTDIHERKKLEANLEDMVRERTRELEEKNRLLDNILRHSSNGISVSELIFDESGNVVDAITILANDAAVTSSGIPRDIYLTKTATELAPGIIESPYGQACIKTQQTGEPSVMQYFLDLTSRWLELTISKMDDQHLIHIFTDITPIKNAQLQLEKSIEDLRYANTNLEEFAYAASHDLKEPVRKVQFFANRLKEDLNEKLDHKQQKLFERLENSAARMLKLIDDLLEYSQSAKGSSEHVEISLMDQMQIVLEDLDLEVAQKGATISFENLPSIRGNKRQIHQLFQNLISNALKYSKPETPPEIVIASQQVSGKDVLKDLPPEALDTMYFMITVSDNGIGFEPRFADVIFNVFTRLHSDPRYRGTGIGLAIVKKVVESHHGHIWAEGVPDKGSTFTILLPVLN
jgi:PAS domain S-box-containing protein